MGMPRQVCSVIDRRGGFQGECRELNAGLALLAQDAQ